MILSTPGPTLIRFSNIYLQITYVKKVLSSYEQRRCERLEVWQHTNSSSCRRGEACTLSNTTTTTNVAKKFFATHTTDSISSILLTSSLSGVLGAFFMELNQPTTAPKASKKQVSRKTSIMPVATTKRSLLEK